MRKFVFHLFRYWIKIGCLFFFKKLRVEGRENLPDKNTAVIFLPNHQNTFLDAFSVGISTSRRNHFMARGDIFSSPKIKKLTSWVNLRPIYRIRDGREALGKNEAVFAELIEFLRRNHGVMLHPEGTHKLQYRTRAISKGFTRIAFGFMEKYPDHPLQLIPVGLNYDRFSRYRSNLTITFGKPIDAHQFLDQDRSQATNEMRSQVEDGIKSLTLQIPEEGYERNYHKLREANVDLSEYRKAQELLKKKNISKQSKDSWQANWIEKILSPIAFISHFPAILIWKRVKPMFKDIAWHGPLKLLVGTFITPLYLLIFTLTLALVVNWKAGLIYLIIATLSAPLLKYWQS